MSGDPASLTGRLAALRGDFDRSFASVARTEATRLVDLLVIRAGVEPCTVRLTELAGLFTRRTVVPVPSRVPELLGVAGFRGAIIPIYDLGVLLGTGPVNPVWLALTPGTQPVGLAFDELLGHTRARPEDLEQPSSAADRPRYTQGTVRAGQSIRTILDVPSIVRTIARWADQESIRSKEAQQR